MVSPRQEQINYRIARLPIELDLGSFSTKAKSREVKLGTELLPWAIFVKKVLNRKILMSYNNCRLNFFRFPTFLLKFLREGNRYCKIGSWKKIFYVQTLGWTPWNLIPDFPHNIRIGLAKFNLFSLHPDVTKSPPCWLSQFSFSKLRQPTGQRLSNVRAQQIKISIGPILFLYYE